MGGGSKDVTASLTVTVNSTSETLFEPMAPTNLKIAEEVELYIEHMNIQTGFIFIRCYLTLFKDNVKTFTIPMVSSFVIHCIYNSDKKTCTVQLLNKLGGNVIQSYTFIWS